MIAPNALLEARSFEAVMGGPESLPHSLLARKAMAAIWAGLESGQWSCIADAFWIVNDLAKELEQ